MAQIYPVTVNTTLVPPQSTYLSDFTTPGSEKLKLIIQLNDFNEPNYDVRLRISITSSEASLVTSENFQPVPLTLYPGPNVLTGSQLADYLDLNNLNLSGVDRQQLQQTSSLPEGYYTFCVQVFDYRRQDVALSSENCNSAYLRKNNPPIPVQPVCNGTIAYSASQNIFFNWQSNADPLIQAQYELKIVDVLEGVSPNDAINGASTPILDNQLVTGTSFLYGPAQVDLEKGHTYAYQIRAFDPLGLTTFENDGLSEVCWFTYGVAGLGYIQLTNPQDNYIFTKTDNLTFRWQGPDNVTPGQQLYYRYRFVEMHDGQTKEEAMLYNAPWADEESNIAHNISSYAMSLAAMLPYDKTFAWQVEAYTDGVLTASSEIWIFSTPKEFDKFRIGDYTVFVNTCNGDLKNFSGTGKIDIEGNGVMTDIQYAGLEIVKSGPSLVVLEGNINSPVENMFMDLDNGDNGKTQFEVKAIKIGRATDFQMNLTGRVKWRLPHPTTVPEPIVYSEIKDVKYIDYSLVSYLNFQETNFDLLDPFGFNIRFSPSSTFLVKDKEVRELKMNGLLSLPANLIKAGNGSRVAIPFEGADNPYYFTNTQVFGVGIRIANNVAVTANPNR